MQPTEQQRTEQRAKEALKSDGFAFAVTSHAEAIMKAHDLAMSTDPQLAAMGRVMKHFLTAWDNALDEERVRDTKPALIMDGLMSAVSSALATAVEMFAKPESRTNAMLLVLEGINRTSLAGIHGLNAEDAKA